MTAVLESPVLSSLTDDELADAWTAADVDDPDVFAAFMAEFARRDQAERAEARENRKSDAEARLRYEWYDAMHAQRMAAEAFCGGGGMLNHEGLRRNVSEWEMWTAPWSTVQRYASEDLLWFFEHQQPRMTWSEYKRQRSQAGRIQREEWRDRHEISNGGNDDERGTELAGNEARTLRHEETAEEAPHAGPGLTVDGGRPAPLLGAEDSDREQPGTSGGAGGTVPPRRLGGGDDMGGYDSDDDGPIGCPNAPAPADCTSEAAQLDGWDEQELQEFGQAMLEEACQFINRFSVLPSRAAGYALVLFAAHCWIYEAFTESPRFHISALSYGAGKTRVMELTSLLCQNPQMMAKITSPAICRIIDERHPSPLCLDEADAMFGKGQRAEDIRGILNAGYKYNGTITRVSGGEAVDFSVYCPVMFAGRGQLPQSLEDRAVTIMMKQRKPGQDMDRFIPKMHDAMGRKIGLMLGAWATKIQGPAGDIIWDDPPSKLADRQVDILTPLYAIAHMAGGEWPARFAEVVDVLMLGGVSTDEVSPARALLAAARDVWPEDAERLATHQLADLLAAHPSGEFNWPPNVRTQELNKQMRDLGIPPVPMRISGTVMRGYDREAVTDSGQA